MIKRRYSGRKTIAKKHFDKMGGYNDPERALSNKPDDMDIKNWEKAIIHFHTDAYIRRSTVNKGNREKQTIKNRGGTRSYTNACYKEELSKLEAYRKAHTNKDGAFDSKEDEDNYNALVCEFMEENEVATSSGNPTPVDYLAIFEKVLGTRRGIFKGIGRKPSTSSTSTSSSSNYFEAQSQTTQNSSMDILQQILNNPVQRAQLTQLVQSFTVQDNSTDPLQQILSDPVSVQALADFCVQALSTNSSGRNEDGNDDNT